MLFQPKQAQEQHCPFSWRFNQIFCGRFSEKKCLDDIVIRHCEQDVRYYVSVIESTREEQLFMAVSLKRKRGYSMSIRNNNALILIQRDKGNNSDHFTTLMIYMDNNLSTKETAEDMYVHVNTMAYRLKKLGANTNRLTLTFMSGLYCSYCLYF